MAATNVSPTSRAGSLRKRWLEGGSLSSPSGLLESGRHRIESQTVSVTRVTSPADKSQNLKGAHHEPGRADSQVRVRGKISREHRADMAVGASSSIGPGPGPCQELTVILQQVLL